MRTLVVPAALVGLALTVPLLAPSLGAARAAEECLGGPKYAAPQGGHWYYRVDRATHRHCWYVGAAGTKARSASSLREGSDRSVPPPAADADQPKRATFADVIASDDAPPAGSSIRWLDQPAAVIAGSPQPAASESTAQGDSASAAEQAPVPAEPLPAVQAASAPEPQPKGSGIGAMVAVIAGAALAAAVSVGVVARLRPAQPPSRTRTRPAFEEQNFDRSVLSAVAEAMAVPSPPVAPQAASMLPVEQAAPPPRPRGDRLDVEQRLERLLQEWERSAA